MWARILQVFTPGDLADAMAVDLEVARRGVRALIWHGIVEDTGDRFYTHYGEEPIIGYVPLPPGPKEHPTGIPPERLEGYTEVLSPRGMRVRIRTERMTRRALSTPGSRQVHRNRERAWERQQQANRERAERERRKRIARQQGRALEEVA